MKNLIIETRRYLIENTGKDVTKKRKKAEKAIKKYYSALYGVPETHIKIECDSNGVLHTDLTVKACEVVRSHYTVPIFPGKGGE